MIYNLAAHPGSLLQGNYDLVGYQLQLPFMILIDSVMTLYYKLLGLELNSKPANQYPHNTDCSNLGPVQTVCSMVVELPGIWI